MQTQDATDLTKLADLAVPPPVPFWPPAPGWIVLFVVGALLFGALIVRFVLRWKHDAYRRAAESELAELTERGEWTSLSTLIKRTALAAYPRTKVASLSGESWTEFIEQTGGSASLGTRLASLAYEPGAAERMSEGERIALASDCRHWIRKHARSLAC